MVDLDKVLLNQKATIKQALKKMDESAQRILFVVSAGRKLLGVITDGDIRRCILKSSDLNNCVREIMNKKPIFVNRTHDESNVKQLMIENHVECIPILDENKKLISAVRWIDIFGKKTTKKKIKAPVIIMAGGEGTRLHPYTRVLPKPLMPIKDKPIVELIINKFAEFGCRSFYLSINYKSNIVKAYFKDFDHKHKIRFIEEKNPLGTAGSLWFLKNKISRPTFVNNCDILVEADYADMLDFHSSNKNMITIVGSMRHFKIPYGICKINAEGHLVSIREKPEYDFLVNTGLYIIEPHALKYVPRNKVYNLTDLIHDCIKDKNKVGVYPVSEKSWFDMGQWESLQDMLKNFEVPE